MLPTIEKRKFKYFRNYCTFYAMVHFLKIGRGATIHAGWV